METVIVLIPVSYFNSRKVCELIQNNTYNNSTELRDYIENKLNQDVGEDEEDERVLLYDINDFMDEVNNQELDVLTNYFLSYVKIKN